MVRLGTQSVHFYLAFKLEFCYIFLEKKTLYLWLFMPSKIVAASFWKSHVKNWLRHRHVFVYSILVFSSLFWVLNRQLRHILVNYTILNSCSRQKLIIVEYIFTSFGGENVTDTTRRWITSVTTSLVNV